MSGRGPAKLQTHHPDDLPDVFQRRQLIGVEPDVESALERARERRVPERIPPGDVKLSGIARIARRLSIHLRLLDPEGSRAVVPIRRIVIEHLYADPRSRQADAVGTHQQRP